MSLGIENRLWFSNFENNYEGVFNPMVGLRFKLTKAKKIHQTKTSHLSYNET